MRRPLALHTAELREPRRGAAQGVCGGRRPLHRGEALAQELPPRAVWSVWPPSGQTPFTLDISV